LAVTVCKSIFKGWVYGSFRHIEVFSTLAADIMLARALFFSLGEGSFCLITEHFTESGVRLTLMTYAVRTV
jgi:hypothetical protein